MGCNLKSCKKSEECKKCPPGPAFLPLSRLLNFWIAWFLERPFLSGEQLGKGVQCLFWATCARENGHQGRVLDWLSRCKECRRPGHTCTMWATYSEQNISEKRLLGIGSPQRKVPHRPDISAHWKIFLGDPSGYSPKLQKTSVLLSPGSELFFSRFSKKYKKSTHLSPKKQT